jgi:hypothetical protein
MELGSSAFAKHLLLAASVCEILVYCRRIEHSLGVPRHRFSLVEVFAFKRREQCKGGSVRYPD